MNIKWNEVTWYSKLLAVILFLIVVPYLTFYIGTEYQKTADINDLIKLSGYEKATAKVSNSLLLPLKGNLKPSIYDSNSIHYTYNTDGNSIYYKMVYADSKSFTPIENGEYVHSYAKDGHNVYYQGTAISGADADTFKILWHTVPEGCGIGEYAKDKNHVYYENLEVQGADLNTFEPLISPYGRDKNNVYLMTQALTRENPKTFKAPCEYGM